MKNSNNNNNNSQKHLVDEKQQQPQLDNKSNSSSNSGSNKSSIQMQHYHLQPHIPIYHQQMAINPVIQSTITGHSKLNLCGYDSYLHATYCDGATATSSAATTAIILAPSTTTATLMTLNNNKNNNNNNYIHYFGQQPIAAVQPLLTSTPIHKQKLQHSTPNKCKITTTTPTTAATATAAAVTAKNLVPFITNIKQSRILRNNSYALQKQQQPPNYHHVHQSAHQVQHNSPQYHGYQHLTSSAATCMQEQKAEQQQPITAIEHVEKWLRENSEFTQQKTVSLIAPGTTIATRQNDGKNNDNLLYARLQEKLHIGVKSTNGKENVATQQQKQQQQKRCRYNNSSSNHNNRSQRQRTTNNRVPNHSPATTTTTTPPPPKPTTLGEKKDVDYTSMIPLNGDPVEFEHLLGQTTDDELVTTMTKTAVTSTPATTRYLPTTLTNKTAAINIDEVVPTTSLESKENELIDLHNEIHDATTNAKEQQALGKEQHHELFIAEDEAVLTPFADVVIEGEVEEFLEEQGLEEEEAEENSSISQNNTSNKLINADFNKKLNNNTNTTCVSSSASAHIHRYVHEHIHHHYHHFEDKDD